MKMKNAKVGTKVCVKRTTNTSYAGFVGTIAAYDPSMTIWPIGVVGLMGMPSCVWFAPHELKRIK